MFILALLAFIGVVLVISQNLVIAPVCIGSSCVPFIELCVLAYCVAVLIYSVASFSRISEDYSASSSREDTVARKKEKSWGGSMGNAVKWFAAAYAAYEIIKNRKGIHSRVEDLMEVGTNKYDKMIDKLKGDAD